VTRVGYKTLEHRFGLLDICHYCEKQTGTSRRQVGFNVHKKKISLRRLRSKLS
jgi:hypothetical protein